ncbi:hypothetical protein ACROSR_19090 [Roseovarius tibetensis]|uniref:hypothetical protein n=1 Tax=Roseovarius tibetensis TaxID=2685897 RepID=UPI003D7F3567
MTTDAGDQHRFFHSREKIFKLADYAPRHALRDRELAHDVMQRGIPMARRGNFSHPVKLRNIVEDMSSDLQSAAEKPGKALISQAL